MRAPRSLRQAAIAGGLLTAAIHAQPAPDSFEREVRPVLERHCYACHSSRAAKPLAGLRLDTREGALAGGKSGPAIVPGKGAASLLIRALRKEDGVAAMPPSAPLPAASVEAIQRWIDLGAPYSASGVKQETWWSLRPLHRTPAPSGIDGFIDAELRRKGLKPAPPASRRDLLRRVYFDLTGLPPSAADVARFDADTAPDAYERLVDRLLASPRYGERQARHWMDVAHFAETDGYESDMMRSNAWPYRDYLIRAFNADKPWARFIQEQIAGDALFPDDPGGTVATGFLAAGPWDSNTIPPFSPDRPDVLRAYALDRDDMVQTVMSSFTSLTVHCARCHDHKFDPIPQREYYALQAVFAGVDRADRPYDEDPAVHARRQELLRTRMALDRRDAHMEPVLRDPARQAEAMAWLERQRRKQPPWRVAKPESMESKQGQELRALPDGSVLASGAMPESDTVTLSFAVAEGRIAALRVELPPHESLPHGGPGRSSMGSAVISEIHAKVRRANGKTTLLCLDKARADYEFAESKGASLTDGRSNTSWKTYPRQGEYRQIVIPLTTPFDASGGDRLVVQIDEGGVQPIGRVRISLSVEPVAEDAELLPETLLSPGADPRAVAAFLWIRRIGAELDAMPKPRPVFAVTNDFSPRGWFAPVRVPRPVFVLERGEVEKPRGEAGPGALSAVTGLNAVFAPSNAHDESLRRVALAEWLSHRDNPLTWRSIANRVWHYHFGRGISDTPNDFGRMGSEPTHPELLDWLAAEFRDSGGSLKRLHRTIVTSAAYRRSSAPNEANAKLDAGNRYLWRMNRLRLDAESLRDAVLAASGRLDTSMGGPSVAQAVVGKGVAGAPAPDYASFDWGGPGSGRRSVYRYTFRTLSDPFMDSLNCPNASIMTGARVHAVDAPQALVLLNNPFVTEQSRHLAAAARAESDDNAGRIRALYRRVLLRDPSPEEAAEASAYAGRHGLENLARVLFNTNEFMFVN